MSERKVCRDCRGSKLLSNFYIDRRPERGGTRPYCKDCQKARNKRQKQSDIRFNLLHTARYRAKQVGREFSLVKEDIEIPEICPLLGIPIEPRVGGSAGAGSPSLDRIDNSKGYTPGNVWVVSYRANVLKHSASLSEIKMIASNLEAEMRRRGILNEE